ncbi:MAG: TIGR03943 family protein [Caldilineaceae bacterium]
MLQSDKFQHALKALLLLALAFFLYSRIATGTLNYYIAQRFAPFTLLALIGLFIVAVSYHSGRRKTTAESNDSHPIHPPMDHEAAHVHSHEHHLNWGGVLLIALPIVLGLLVSPRPLGSAALANREVNVTVSGSIMPAAIRSATQKAATDKNILDWSQLFGASSDPAQQYAGQPANVIGFVFRDERFAENQFMATRFVISCCVADSNPAGIVVEGAQTHELPADQWVEVQGVFQPGKLDGQTIPVLVAQSIRKVPVPEQPYLYP